MLAGGEWDWGQEEAQVVLHVRHVGWMSEAEIVGEPAQLGGAAQHRSQR